MRWLIAGCGDLGLLVAAAVRAQGATVWGLRRHIEKLPDWLPSLRADLATGEGLDRLPAIDVVLYTASADRYSDEAYRAAYVDGPRHLIDALERRQHPGSRPRWLHVSSTSVYAQSDGSWVDEDSPTRPASFGGQRLLEGEVLLRGRPDSVVLRLAGLYGPGRARLVDRIRSGEARRLAPPVHTNRIHLADAARALVHLATLSAPERLYLGVDDAPVLDGEVKTWLADRLGVANPPIAGASPTSRAMRSNKRCSNRRLRASGFRFRFPDYRSGYESLLVAREKSNRDPS
ncbi:MAG: SDR family oxidoreductase [Acidobacteriota bacterium]